jgi:hypothetical protein
VAPRGPFERIVAGSEIRYFSDISRYAVLYEHGGLWMDSDMILLRPFPFCGDHFFNLQWHSGAKKEHFVCGNVSRHLRALYEAAIERFFGTREWEFGMVGLKLLSDYIAPDAGAELRDRLFSPAFFNPIDWTEIERFDKPLAQLADYLHNERLFGIHLWAARNDVCAGAEGAPLGALLADPLASFPTLTSLAGRFNTDKNRHTGNRHCYARIHDRLLADKRFSMRRVMVIGLCRGPVERNLFWACTPRDREDARTRLLMPFGAGLHVDAVAGELRYGLIESSPANALFVADPPAHHASTILARSTRRGPQRGQR